MITIPFVYAFLVGLGLITAGFITGAIIFAGENRNRSLAVQAEIRARGESYQYYFNNPELLATTPERDREWMIRQNQYVLLENAKIKKRQNRKPLLGRTS